MKRIFTLVIFTLSLSLIACQTESETANYVAFDELVAQPSTHSGNFLCTEGVYLSGFEESALGAATFERDGYPYLTDPTIWIEGAEITPHGECRSFQSYQFCPVLTCGRFEYGSSYGHLGGYNYQIRNKP